MGQLLAGQIPGFVMEKRLVTQGGGVTFVQTSVSLLADAGGPPNILAIIEDITARHQAEHALKDSEEYSPNLP